MSRKWYEPDVNSDPRVLKLTRWRITIKCAGIHLDWLTTSLAIVNLVIFMLTKHVVIVIIGVSNLCRMHMRACENRHFIDGLMLLNFAIHLSLLCQSYGSEYEHVMHH